MAPHRCLNLTAAMRAVSNTRDDVRLVVGRQLNQSSECGYASAGGYQSAGRNGLLAVPVHAVAPPVGAPSPPAKKEPTLFGNIQASKEADGISCFG